MKLMRFIGVCLLGCSFSLLQAASPETIRVTTGKTDLILKVDTTGRLCQSYLGSVWTDGRNLDVLPAGKDAYQPYDLQNFFEPAVRMTHADGNNSSLFRYVSHTQEALSPTVTRTVVTLRDDVYPVEVKLYYDAFSDANIIKAWTEISHREKRPVLLQDFASSLLYFARPAYYLTEFTGKWGNETTMTEQKLTPGKKVLDTRLGARAAMLTSPFFILGLDAPARETEGEVVLGTLNWTGNFRFTFDIDASNDLRVVSGINPYASEYNLRPGEVFRTPEFVFTYSDKGTGEASRSFHDWARDYQLKDGHGPRLTLLNNWEATGFAFDEKKLSHFMREAAILGVDMFLLDDGWFGNKYPRSSDKSGLGDWEPTASKLPNGVGGLVRAADSAGVKFGIWIEPEMTNTRSELYEKHPDWVIQQPYRENRKGRGGTQQVLDLSNPAVQEFVFGVVDRLMTAHPDIAYIKWDDNMTLYNYGSTFLPADRQSHLYIEYHRGMDKVLRRIREKYPRLVMQSCASGGGRVNYGVLPYYDEFWTSDNTDALQRIYMQWGVSNFYPAVAMASHVSASPNHQTGRNVPLKLRFDVAMSGRLGLELQPSKMTGKEKEFARRAIANYKEIRPIVQQGDLYRLISPYDKTGYASLMYVAPEKDRAVWFVYKLEHFLNMPSPAFRMAGLDPGKRYRITELNVDGKPVPQDGKTFSGAFLMENGLEFTVGKEYASRVLELKAVE